jgi:multiple sugar transport system ATP-binding protein
VSLEGQLQTNAQLLSPDLQRFVGLARTMVRQPNVYLFDEPFAGLEPEAARRGRAEIVKLHQRSSATIIYATSVASEALAFGTRTIVVADGLTQQDGLARDIYDAPANLAVAKFFGDLPMNLVAGTLNQGRNGVVFSEAGDGTISLALPVDSFPRANDFVGKRVLLGFRPEDVEIESSAESRQQAGMSYRALVERTEERGADAELHLQTGAHTLIVRDLRSDGPVHGGQRIQFRIALHRALLFDAESGRGLRESSKLSGS